MYLKTKKSLSSVVVLTTFLLTTSAFGMDSSFDEDQGTSTSTSLQSMSVFPDNIQMETLRNLNKDAVRFRSVCTADAMQGEEKENTGIILNIQEDLLPTDILPPEIQRNIIYWTLKIRGTSLHSILLVNDSWNVWAKELKQTCNNRECSMLNHTIIQQFPNITALDLCKNNTITDEALKALTKLESLSLRKNELITNEGIKNLNKLRLLSLGGFMKFCPIITDEAVINFTNLTGLDLTMNKVVTDRAIMKLTNLRRLNLGANAMISDKGIEHALNIETLTLEFNHSITNDGIKYLSNITSLNLGYNKNITNDGIHHLKNLTFLDLRGNEVITEEGYKGLQKLTKISL